MVDKLFKSSGSLANHRVARAIYPKKRRAGKFFHIKDVLRLKSLYYIRDYVIYDVFYYAETAISLITDQSVVLFMNVIGTLVTDPLLRPAEGAVAVNYDPMQQAVLAFQRQYGLAVEEVIGRNNISALNIPIHEKLPRYGLISYFPDPFCYHREVVPIMME